MKTPKLEIRLEIPEKPYRGNGEVPFELTNALARAAALARGRKQTRNAWARTLVKLGHSEYRTPHAESWRDLVARYLRRVLPAWCAVYRGGHHLAVHVRNTDGGLSGCCLARFVEVRPI